MSTLTATGLLIPLAEAGDEPVAGGKAATLARLISLGVPVPHGLVLTCDAFEQFLSSSSLRRGIDEILARDDRSTDSEFLEQLSARVRALVMEAPLPIAIAGALRDAAASLPLAEIVAVRSSAVGEDGEYASFAGQFDSVLGVDDPIALEHAVRVCWASYWSARALFYRQSRGLGARGMGVVIQQQVPAIVAGVLFTRNPDPHGASDEMILEYAAGLADRLVAGEIDPGRLHLSRSTCDVVTELHGDDPSGDARQALTPERLEDLGRLAMGLERALGAPQDIEWVIGADGDIAIVQSRPVTTLARGPESSLTGMPAEAAHDAGVLWSNANVNENFPEPLSPLLYSIASAGYYHYFRNLGMAFGVSRRRLAAMDPALRAIIGVHGARIYYNLTSIHAVLRMAPYGERLASAFNLFVGADATAPQPVRAASWADERRHARRLAEIARIAGSVVWQFLFLERRLRAFERTADAFAARTTPESLEGRSLAALGADLTAFVDIRCRRWKNASLCDTAAMVSYALLRHVLRRNGMGDETHTRLLRALPGVPSSTPALRLWALSRTIASDDALAALFDQQPAAAALAAVRGDARFADFRRQLDQFLECWGFRSSGELMLTIPTLEEHPEPVVELLAQYARATGESPEASIARQAAERRDETARVLRTVARRAPVQALMIWILLRSTQRAVSFRERARLKQALLYTRCRRVALRIGEALARARRLVERNDVFMLTWEEIDEICAGRSMFPQGTAELVRLRRTQHAAQTRLDPPDSFRLAEGAAFDVGSGAAWTADTRVPPSRPDVARSDADNAAVCGSGDLLRGTTACGGRVSARAAVLAGVHEARRLSQGDVLVTRQTDPGWAPVFCLVSGLVIERGGMLSHGAIIAREFGLPCIVGVKGAAARIPHGARLTVDADRGECRVEGRP